MSRVASADENSMPIQFSICLLIVALLLIASCDSTISAQTVERDLIIEASRELDEALIDNTKSLETYEQSDSYLVFDVDINMDGTPDKIVSSGQNKGNELIFFKSIEGSYRAVLVSTNLTEDGGRILGEIKQEAGGTHENEVASIETFFPKGMDTATHYIAYSENGWELSRTIYVTSDWRNRVNAVHLCEVAQNVPMTELVSEEGTAAIRQIPDESDRDQICDLESMPET